MFTPLPDVIPVSISGIVTAHDNLVIDFKDDRLIENASILRGDLCDEDVRAVLYVNDNSGWKISKARRELRKSLNDQQFLKSYAYRPFDTRRIYYHPSLVWSDRRKVMSHVLEGRNIALATCRQLAEQPWEHVFVTRYLQDDSFISNRTRERSYHFPLFLKPSVTEESVQPVLLSGKDDLSPNLSHSYVTALKLKLGYIREETYGLKEALLPEDIFSFAYAVFYSPKYRSRYSEFLKIDFPRLPLTDNLALFRALSQIGNQLVALHLMESPLLYQRLTTYIGSENPLVEKVSYTSDTVYLDKAQTCGFRGMFEDVWNFHIGCYQVCEKWLKDRKGRRLSEEEIDHYQKIVVALSETIRLMQEIDVVIEERGGWPDAFSNT
jgi:predicted helicase